MAFLVLVAGIGLIVAGLLAIGFGIPIKEFSTGNTLILAGAIGVCTGAIMLGLWVAVRELKNIARRLSTGLPEAREEPAVRPAPAAAVRETAPALESFPAAEPIGIGDSGAFSSPPAFSPAPPPPWQNEAVLRDHPIPEPLHPPEPPSPAAKPKRNLMFSSTSRKERERAQSRPGEAPSDLLFSEPRSRPPAMPPVETADPPPAPLDDSWPGLDRAKPADTLPPRRGNRMPPSLAEANIGPSFGRQTPEVTVLKSGIVDGMAYSLYSDGSIEAEMPEGMMRFASIDELRVHLDQRS